MFLNDWNKKIGPEKKKGIDHKSFDKPFFKKKLFVFFSIFNC